MPREVLPVETFTKGIIGSISPGDIPEGAASFSVDIDNALEQGMLQGRFQDETNWGCGFLLQNLTITRFITEEDGSSTLIGFDKLTGLVNAYPNFPNGTV